MERVDLESFLKKDEELRNQTKEMMNFIIAEMIDILSHHCCKVEFEPVEDPSDNKYLIKGFQLVIAKSGEKIMCLGGRKDDKYNVYMPWSHNYYIQKGYGFKTIRTLAAYLKIMRKAVKKK